MNTISLILVCWTVIGLMLANFMMLTDQQRTRFWVVLMVVGGPICWAIGIIIAVILAMEAFSNWLGKEKESTKVKSDADPA